MAIVDDNVCDFRNGCIRNGCSLYVNRKLCVDAALDATNVARVAHYIRDKTRGLGNINNNGDAEHRGEDTGEGPSSFQSIVISLKDIFYEKADALVGVARDVDGACSRTFTFDLSAFGEPQPAED
ncbi:hypothetical protein DUNSADRAFT_4948 [Dunaliella salina]|uniref:Encoded protein n=1 Tax=Dunaliella salina TaxID=3046 RepID=A0ABQ7GR23_DUNSA|nr:hypothetical protein DUNSADRAFT_4948 [Dunaliella salina]|eukprot:KAF5837023.1 hypothetical protein DUNSADRAFT_4948 [Dunaliella salina]